MLRYQELLPLDPAKLVHKNRAGEEILQNSFPSIMPQLSKCLKFEAVWGVLIDQMI